MLQKYPDLPYTEIRNYTNIGLNNIDLQRKWKLCLKIDIHNPVISLI